MKIPEQISWIRVEKGVAKKLSEPIIYFNPDHKKIFFNAPYPFKGEDKILISISLDKRYLVFSKTFLTDITLQITEFNDKSKASVTAAVLFAEFPDLFKESNKYQSKLYGEADIGFDSVPLSLIIDLHHPMDIKRKQKKERKTAQLQFKNFMKQDHS